VVDDHASFRAALREVVDAADGFALAGEASSGEAAIEAVGELAPHMVIMDKRMPGMGGIEATRVLTAANPGLVVVLISAEAPDEPLMRSCGAAAFVRKQDVGARLLQEVWRDRGSCS
jgi:DNA-binding NarL/FixJ family response regulator